LSAKLGSQLFDDRILGHTEIVTSHARRHAYANGYNPASMEVPNKEIVGVVEGVFGKTGAKVLITVIVVGAAVTAIGGAWAALRSFYSGVSPYLPSAVPLWMYQVAALVMIAFLTMHLVKFYRRLAKQLDDDARNRLRAQETIRALEERVKELEAESQNETSLQAVLQKLREDEPEAGIDQRWSEEQKTAVKKGRALLFEAAQKARDGADGKGDLDKLSRQAWLIVQCKALIRNGGYGFRVYKDFEDRLDYRKKVNERNNAEETASEALSYLADYFEQTIPTLTPGDVEDISKYPDTFAAFMKS
jgi:hypothetical protein